MSIAWCPQDPDLLMSCAKVKYILTLYNPSPCYLNTAVMVLFIPVIERFIPETQHKLTHYTSARRPERRAFICLFSDSDPVHNTPNFSSEHPTSLLVSNYYCTSCCCLLATVLKDIIIIYLVHFKVSEEFHALIRHFALHVAIIMMFI